MFSLKTTLTTALICISLFACTYTANAPASDLKSVEVHSDTLVRWAEAGIRDAVVINIDAHDDIRVNEEQQLSELRELMKQKDWEEFARVNTLADDGLYNVGNFLYAAAKLGIVKEVYWIIPFPLFRDSNAEAMLQYMLRFSRFSEDVIETFSMKNGCYSGSYEEISLAICGIENLPDINEPVILSIDVDFFPEYARTYFSTITDGVTALFNAVNQKEYNIIDKVVSYSISGGFLKPRHRWVGELVEEAVLKPGIISRGIPERYILLQGIETEIRRGAFNRAFEQVTARISERDNPALKVYQAEALFKSGQVEASLSPAFDACRVDDLYCYELPQLAMALVEQGNSTEAVRFFSLGYAGNSEMDLGQAEYGAALSELGRYNEALSEFERYRKRHGSFPIDLMITAAYIRLGEKAPALETLRGVLKKLSPAVSNMVVTEQLAEAVVTILDFCKTNAYAEELRALESSSLFQVHRKRYPALFKQQ